MANVDSLNVASVSKKDPPLRGNLYPIYETSMLCGGSKYYRVNFTGSETDPKGILNDTFDIAYGWLYDARAVTRPSGRQDVAVLAQGDGMLDQLSVITKTYPAINARAVKSEIKKVTIKFPVDPYYPGARIIGYNPDLPEKRSLALLVPVEHRPGRTRFAVMEVDVDSGVCGEPRHLPPEGDVYMPAANLVRRGSSTSLVWLTGGQKNIPGKLRLHAMAWEHLADQVKEADVDTLTLGDFDSQSWPWAPPGVPMLVTSMRANSADPQIAVGWGGVNIALVGWGAGGKLTPLATVKLPNPEGITLAAADLLHKGVDQLVLGTQTGLMLLTLDEKSDGTASLNCFSKLDWDLTEPGWIDFGVWIDAGLFGTCMGVQVVACAAKEGQKQIFTRCGFVPVDPNLGFRPNQKPYWAWIKDLMGDPNERVIPTGGVAIPFRTDLGGQSVRLGEPKLQPVDVCNQILAVIQVPPYDISLTKDLARPTIHYSKSINENSGYSVSSDSAYSFSKDFAEHLQIGDFLSLGKNVQDSFMRSFTKMAERGENINVSFGATGDTHDLLLVYGMSYDVWRYPVESSVATAKNEILVVVPTARPEVKIVEGYHPEYGYRPRSEVGMLLSYFDVVKKDGFNEANRLFEPISIPVSESPGGSSESGDALKSIGASVGTHYSISNSISTSAQLTLQTELFGFLPINFGLNVSEHETFANSTVSTAHTTGSEHMNWSVSSGSVRDSIYSYNIKPCIYMHEKLGFLVISWDVDLSPGANYNLEAPVLPANRRLDDPDICLMRVAPFSADVFQKSFSRSIWFDDTTPEKLTIEVDVFNNSIRESGEVTCELFEGKPMPVYDDHVKAWKLEPPKKHLGQATCAGLKTRGREKLKLTVQKPRTTPCYITVQVSCKGGPPKKKIYWNIYPADQLASNQLRQEA
jgi:hypothetical protein